MNTEQHDGLTHEECLELIPEHVNGQLDSDTSRRVQTHLSECGDCFSAQSEAVSLRETLAEAEPGLEPLLQTPRREANLARVLGDIDALSGVPWSEGRAEPVAPRRSLRGWRRLPPGWRFAFVAQSFALVACITVMVSVLPHDREEPVYRTFAAPGTPAGASATSAARRYRVVFEAGASEGDIRALMIALDAEVVGGPSVAGAYTIASRREGAPDQILATLRDSEWIRLAEEASY